MSFGAAMMAGSMELDQFISDTLTQIIRGVEAARQQAGNAAVAPPDPKASTKGSVTLGNVVYEPQDKIRLVEFDVGLTVVQSTETKGKGRISVAWIGVGGEHGVERSTASVSRVRFEVPINVRPYDPSRD